MTPRPASTLRVLPTGLMNGFAVPTTIPAPVENLIFALILATRMCYSLFLCAVELNDIQPV